VLEVRGIGSVMAKTALQFARYNSLSVQPLCPYITGYIKKHPETQDLLKKGFVLG
jgi:predicted GNAT family acetyltransferase